MKADPAQQRRLLDLQAADSRLDQLAHAVRTMPELADLERLGARLATLDVELVTARTEASDIDRELAKAEADVDLVRQRAERDRQRLEAGTGTAKELQGLQSELESLNRRQAALEDVQVEVMERAEAAAARIDELTAQRAEVAAEFERTEADKDVALGALAREASQVEGRRAGIVPELAADLLALYDKVRAAGGGTGAAALSARRCLGCQLEINPSELQRLRAAAPDEVLRCEECRCILVRTEDSGL